MPKCSTITIYSQLLESPDHTTLPAQHFRSSCLLLQVRQSGTRYWTMSVTRRSAATVSDNRWRRICFIVTTQHTQHSRDASWLRAI